MQHWINILGYIGVSLVLWWSLLRIQDNIYEWVSKKFRYRGYQVITIAIVLIDLWVLYWLGKIGSLLI